MKRFFYTTAAVVAFAFSGMANTIELENKFDDSINCEMEDEHFFILNCRQIAVIIATLEHEGFQQQNGERWSENTFNYVVHLHEDACNKGVELTPKFM